MNNVKLFMERPEQIPEEVWRFLPAFPLEYSGICGLLPLPRFILEGICAPPEGAAFSVSDLVITPHQVNLGQSVVISCLVTNCGTEAGEYTVILGGDFTSEQVVSLGPEESTTVSFEVIPEAAGTYSVKVNGLSGSFQATGAPVADIRVENLVIEPAEVYVGETVLISVTATNYGTTSGSKRIVCTVT